MSFDRKAGLGLAVVFGFSTLGFERTNSTAQILVDAALGRLLAASPVCPAPTKMVSIDSMIRSFTDKVNG